MAFRSENNVGSTHSFISGLNHAACWTPVYASQLGSPPHHATLGSGGWLILTGSGLPPAGFQQEVSILSVILSSDIPLLQALPGALPAETLLPTWHGEAMDMGMAVEGVLLADVSSGSRIAHERHPSID